MDISRYKKPFLILLSLRVTLQHQNKVLKDYIILFLHQPYIFEFIILMGLIIRDSFEDNINKYVDQ